MGNSTLVNTGIKDKIVKAIQTHVGIHTFAGKTTIERIKTVGSKEIHYCDFTIYPGVGVHVKLTDGAEEIVPFSNVIRIQLETESSGLKPVA